MKVLITGGNSDIAKYLKLYLDGDMNFEVFSPDRKELDVSLPSSVENYFNEKSFDIVINCAGGLYSSNIINSNPELWINDINCNLIGTYLVSRSALIKNRLCKVINISSTAAFNAYEDWSSYCSAKAGVIKLTQSLAKGGFDVIAVCPGAINTKLRKDLSIINNNVMTIEEGVKPIIKAVQGCYNSGDIVFYRKNEISINPVFSQNEKN